MNIKLIGAILTVSACGAAGFRTAKAYIREETTLRRLIAALDYMECELQYRLTPLPDLCRQAAAQSAGVIRRIFAALANELEDQISPDVQCCMLASLEKVKDVPPLTKQEMRDLGAGMGRFDMEGQLRGLEAVRADCRNRLQELSCNRDVRVRSYQTLGLCAGAAIAILML